MENKGENYSDSKYMQHRRIHLSDGRYLIFFTFDPSLSVDSADDAVEKTQLQPVDRAAEEKDV